MLDVVAILVFAALFGVAFAYISGCDHLKAGRQ